MGSPLLTNLDQGTTIQFVNAYLGPSLGWQTVPVAAETDVTTSTYSVGLFDNRVLLMAACSSVLLPSVAEWVEAQTPIGLNWAGFTRELWIKDYANLASVASPIVVTPNGADTIDLLGSYSISTPGELLRLFPLTDLSGWYVG